jgi:RhtB (resistance to homoserine/threonine) family protein
MFDTSTLLIYIVAATALVLAPGPGQALVLARSISGGRKAGVLTSLGLNVGTLVHTLAAGLGLSAILASSALAFSVVKFLGAAYLIYMGIKTFRDKQAGLPTNARSEQMTKRAFFQSIVTGILNPKVALFFLAFLPQFVDPRRGPVMVQFIVLGVILAVIAITWDTILASVTDVLGQWLVGNPRFALWRQRTTGAVLVGLGIQLAFAQRE